MYAPLFGASALLIAVAVVAYLACASHPPHQEPIPLARRARVAAFTACFASSFTAVPSVATAVDTLTGRGGVGTLCSNLAGQVAVFSLQITSEVWALPEDELPDELRRSLAGWMLALGGVMAVLTSEFLLTDVSSAQLASASPSDIAVTIYMLTHLCVLGAMTAWLIRRYGQLARAVWPDHRAAALGLAATATGTAVGLGYAVGRAGAVVSYLLGHPWPPVDAYVVPAAGGLGTLFVTLGLTLPTIAHRIVSPPADDRSGV